MLPKFPALGCSILVQINVTNPPLQKMNRNNPKTWSHFKSLKDLVIATFTSAFSNE